MAKDEIFVESSNVYLIPPQHLRNLGLELMKRNRGNAYRSHREYKRLTDEERAQIYDSLKEKIRAEGFSREHPITVKLKRKNGEDKILQGHHRLSIAIELGLDVVPVRFVS